MLLKKAFLTEILSLIVLICILPSNSILADEEKQPTDWDRITSIDPLKEEIGDFLDHDLNLFQFRAEEAFGTGDYLNAAKYYLFILHHRTDSPIALYNLACCYSKLNRPDLAAKYVLKAVQTGFYNIDHFLKDKDFDPVRGKSEFDKTESDIKDLKEAIGEEIFIVTSKILKGRLHLPEKYDPSRSYPLVIGLHGYGGNAENFASMWKNFENKDFFFLVPEAPYELHDPGIIGPSFGWFFLTPDHKIWEFADPITAANIIEATEQILAKYKIDRTYLFGFSQGVSAAFITAYQKPDLFKGVIAFAGRLPEDDFLPKKNIEAFKKLKFYIAHGKNDKAVALIDSENTIQKLKAMGCETSFYEFEGGHFIDPEAINQILEMILENKNQ